MVEKVISCSCSSGFAVLHESDIYIKDMDMTALVSFLVHR
jgi:hypothetical protein